LGSSLTAAQQASPPVLVSEATSTRAIALDSPTLTTQPFQLSAPIGLYSNERTRVALFVLGVTLQPGEGLSALRAEAEDGQGRHYDLAVEDFRGLPNLDWMKQIVLRLSDDMGDVGDCLVKVSYRNVPSNRVRVAIGHFGGGPPDDPGAGPSLAPPYTIAGRVTVDGANAAGVTVMLGGAESATAVTNSQGVYSLTVNSAGDYTVTPVYGSFLFTPSVTTFRSITGNRSADFSTSTASITGRVKDEMGNGAGDVVVTLSGGFSSSAVTAADGSFAFLHVPAFQNYTIKPADSSLLFYPAQTIPLLGDTITSFAPVRQSYALSGTVTNGFGAGISGVTIRVTGGVPVETSTDFTGHYVFPSLMAGLNYHVTARSPNFIFNPAGQDVFNLLGNLTTADFHGSPGFSISGRASDSNGQPLFGIKILLSGATISTTTTAFDGTYYFTVASGNYSVTPSFEQGFYSFAPASRNVAVTTPRPGMDFIGSFSPITSPISVLEFDGTPMNVDHGQFWPQRVNLGHFFWEFWAMPAANNFTRYLMSDGYGGAHALLFGFNFSELGHYNLFGNIWQGNGAAVTFNSIEGPTENEWGHYAVGWDGQNVITYFNGVPVGKEPFSGPRQTLGGDSGSGNLFIGGSDHQNMIGRIAQARGYEGQNPRASAPESPFTPETLFSREGNFMAQYMRPSSSIADLTKIGYENMPHDGLLRGMTRGFYDPCSGCPVPNFVSDATAPNFADTANPGHTTAISSTPPSPPAGARVFDSFTRNTSTYILNGQGGLGVTESGSEGALTWQMSSQPDGRKPFGILSGRAVLLADSRALAWVATAHPDQDIQVNRGAASWGNGFNTGIAFRVIDPEYCFFAYTTNQPQGELQQLTVGYYVNGARAELASNVPIPWSWTKLRVVTALNGRLEVYIDNTLMYSATNPVLANVTGVGLYNNASGMALTNRWDNFTVLAIP
jgi:hypothetical protein